MQKLKQCTPAVKSPHSRTSPQDYVVSSQNQYQDIPSRSKMGLLLLTQLTGLPTNQIEKISRQATTIGDLQRLLSSPSSRLPKRAFSAQSWQKAYSLSQMALEEAHKRSISILSITEPDYPTPLRAIPNRPPILYVKGTLPSSNRLVACIGTRRPSHWGLEVTRRITNYLVQEDYGIVSGLALGIDAQAHDTALESGGYTIAILANGLDSVYPSQHRQLSEEIIESGGALISENPFGAQATPHALIQRNRLQSGLSLATIVMQSASSGGSMHTTTFTLQQDRLLCTPAPEGRYAREKASQGNLKLLSNPKVFGLQGISDLSLLLERLKEKSSSKQEIPQSIQMPLF